MLWSHRSAGDRAEHRSAPPHQQGKGCGRWSRSPDPRETSHSLLQGCARSASKARVQEPGECRRVQHGVRSVPRHTSTWQLPGRTANGDMWQEMEARLRLRYLQKPAPPLDISRMSDHEINVRLEPSTTPEPSTRTKHQSSSRPGCPTSRVPRTGSHRTPPVHWYGSGLPSKACPLGARAGTGGG